MATEQLVVGGPLAGYEAGYRAWLVGRGYKPRSLTVLVRRVMRLGEWMRTQGVDVGELCPERAEEFLVEIRGDRRRPTVAVFGSLFLFLREQGIESGATASPVSESEAVLEAFREYLLSERAVVARTADVYVRVTSTFLSWLEARGVGLADLGAAEVVAFATESCPAYSTSWARMILTGVRSFLAFAHVEGLVPQALGGALPSAAGWSGTGLAQGVPAGDLRRLLASCDRRRSKGRRDYAILVVLARLGLRAVEVAALSLDDIDWRNGEILIRGKGNNLERLPLPADVGEAIVGYLHRGRPNGSERAVFLTVYAPTRGLEPSGVAAVVREACRRAGLEPIGPHRLRHTAATEMLRAGSTLTEVAQVLRHHKASTTAIYAKVDHLALRQLATPWPTKES